MTRASRRPSACELPQGLGGQRGEARRGAGGEQVDRIPDAPCRDPVEHREDGHGHGAGEAALDAGRDRMDLEGQPRAVPAAQVDPGHVPRAARPGTRRRRDGNRLVPLVRQDLAEPADAAGDEQERSRHADDTWVTRPAKSSVAPKARTIGQAVGAGRSTLFGRAALISSSVRSSVTCLLSAPDHVDDREDDDPDGVHEVPVQREHVRAVRVLATDLARGPGPGRRPGRRCRRSRGRRAGRRASRRSCRRGSFGSSGPSRR